MGTAVSYLKYGLPMLEPGAPLRGCTACVEFRIDFPAAGARIVLASRILAGADVVGK